MRYEVGALFAFPLEVGPLKIGAVDMYSRTAIAFDQEPSSQAEAMAGVVARRILQGVLRRSSDEYVSEPDNSFLRRLVHQATGMVLAQLDISADDARLVIQGRAFAPGRSMMDVSRDILDGRLDVSAGHGGIEGER